MTIHNNTNFTPGDIAQMKYLGMLTNEWRQKRTWIYANPMDPESVVSVEIDFNETKTTVWSEPRIAWGAILDEFKTSPVVVTQ